MCPVVCKAMFCRVAQNREVATYMCPYFRCVALRYAVQVQSAQHTLCSQQKGNIATYVSIISVCMPAAAYASTPLLCTPAATDVSMLLYVAAYVSLLWLCVSVATYLSRLVLCMSVQVQNAQNTVLHSKTKMLPPMCPDCQCACRCPYFCCAHLLPPMCPYFCKLLPMCPYFGSAYPLPTMCPYFCCACLCSY